MTSNDQRAQVSRGDGSGLPVVPSNPAGFNLIRDIGPRRVCATSKGPEICRDESKPSAVPMVVRALSPGQRTCSPSSYGQTGAPSPTRYRLGASLASRLVVRSGAAKAEPSRTWNACIGGGRHGRQACSTSMYQPLRLVARGQGAASTAGEPSFSVGVRRYPGAEIDPPSARRRLRRLCHTRLAQWGSWPTAVSKEASRNDENSCVSHHLD